MEKQLHQLETRRLHGDDGREYVVQGYEHLVRPEGALHAQWEPTGEVEYRLSTGERVESDRAGRLRVAATGVTLDQPRG
jgi:hypothetical protein